LGHKRREITAHYSAAEIGNLVAAANRVLTAGNTGRTIKESGTFP
jgi:hypothetical protein